MHRTIAIALSVVSAQVLLVPGGAAQERPTAPILQHHRTLEAELARIDREVGALSRQQEPAQRQTMRRIVAFFEERIRPHAEWEERKLYPAVDAQVKATRPERRFTETMRFEHRLIGDHIARLDQLARQKDLDPVAFQRQADRLLGVIEAHFAKENEVFLPVLDRTMTAERVRREILGEGGAPRHEHP